MSFSLVLLVAMYSTRYATDAAHFHLLTMEQSGIVEIIDTACIQCLSRYDIAFWTPSHLKIRHHPRAVIQRLNPSLLAISAPPSGFKSIEQQTPDLGLIEEPGYPPLALEIRDYLLPGMAGLVLVIESPWVAKVNQGIDGNERLLKRCLTMPADTPRGDGSA